ncbi:MAG: sodium:solute symporter family protein [Puniceicoccaceae bacterium]
MILSPLDTGIIVIYFIAMIAIGISVMRRASKNLDSYFLGGHSMPWWVLGLSNASAMWDITGTMWLVYNLYVYGLKGTWLPWLWPTFNQVILMVYLASWVRRSKVLTGAEWMSTRFASRVGGEMSRAIIVIFALVSVVAFIAYAFQGIGKFSAVFLPWDWSPNTYAIIVMSITAIYVLMGGMLSVVYTDLAQFFIMLICAIILAVIAMVQVSGAEIAAIVPEGWGNLFFGWKLDMDWSNLIPALNDNIAKDGYSLFGIFFMAMVCKGLLVSIAGPAPNYDMQRILAARSSREAGMMSGIVSAALFPRWILIAAITLIGLKFLGPKFANLDPAFTTADGGVDFEMVLPFVIREFVPMGLMGLLLAGLLAAFMSTFSATLNAGGAYLVNDLYKRYLKKDANPKHYVGASYIAQILILIIGFVIGFNLSSVNQITQWIVNGLWGGYTAANVLKWHWWRLNGHGYFWGMLVGILSAIMVPVVIFPESNSLLDLIRAFPVIFGLSLIGCIAGSLLTEPEGEDILKKFYSSVRPWGFWKPIHAKVVAENPEFVPGNFIRDASNTVVAIIWQIPLWTIPVFAVFRDMRGLWISIFVLIITSTFLKFNWFDKLTRESD